MKTEIEELKEELYLAYDTTLNMIPFPGNRWISGYHDVTSYEELNEWENTAIQKVMDGSRGDYKEDSGHSRKPCPLCGQAPVPTIEDKKGFTREGLSRHLEGSHKSRKCKMMHAARRVGILYMKENAIRQQQEQQHAVAKEKTARLISENPLIAKVLGSKRKSK